MASPAGHQAAADDVGVVPTSHRLAKELKLKSDVSKLPTSLPGKQHGSFMRGLKSVAKSVQSRHPADVAQVPPT